MAEPGSPAAAAAGNQAAADQSKVKVIYPLRACLSIWLTINLLATFQFHSNFLLLPDVYVQLGVDGPVCPLTWLKLFCMISA